MSHGTLRLAAVVVLTACASDDGPGLGISETEFWEQIGEMNSCMFDRDCAFEVGPCDHCPVGIPAATAASFRELARTVDCRGSGDRPCTTDRFPVCENFQCILAAEPGGPPECGSEGCNPVANVGCEGGEKCTFEAYGEAPFWGCSDCEPVGPKQDGEPCTPPAFGFPDDCGGQLFCLDGVCTEICSTASDDGCDAGEVCIAHDIYFADVPTVGLCRPGCDPLAGGCVTGESCYAIGTSGRGFCAVPYTSLPISSTGAPGCSAAPGTQGCNCARINGCAPGYGCLFSPEAPEQFLCAFACDATASGGPGCADGPGVAYECQPIGDLPELGRCVSP
jgi:hypothetical protein